MSLLKLLPLFCVLCGWGFGAQGAEICFSSVAEFESKKSDMPVVIRKLPVLFTANNFLVTAGLQIKVVDSKLKLEGSIWKPGEIYSDDSYIKNVCFEDDVLKVTLENGKTYEARVKNDSAVSIQGMTFKKSTAVEFAGILEKVKDAESKRNGNARNASGAQ